MDSASSNVLEQGKQPGSSRRGVLSTFFTRDRSASSDVDTAVLLSFKELPDGETYDADASRAIKTESKLQAREDAAQGDETAKPSISDSGEQTKAAAGVQLDSDLVQVTMVETHSDTENEDDDATHKARKSTQSEDDKEDKEDGDVTEADLHVPMFRTHKLTERSRVEAILYSSRFAGRTTHRRVQLSSISKKGNGGTPTVSVSAEPLAARDVGTGESEEYDEIDCSQPVPSIISGHQALNTANVASPTKQTNSTHKEEPSELESVPSSLETQNISVQSSCPEEQLDAGFKKPSSPSSPSKKTTSPPGASPDAELKKIPKMADISTSASSLAASSTTSTSSPSRGTEISSPPSFQMPALFSGLRVLKKGGVGEDREVVSEIKQREKDADLALLNLKKSVNKAKLFPEQRAASPVKKQTEPKPVAETKSNVMGQLSQLLNLDNNDDTKNSGDAQKEDSLGSKSESADGEAVSGERTTGSETPASTPERKKTSDLAYETFKNIFGPKPAKKEKAEDVDLEAVKKKIKNDKENLRSIFERSAKSPVKEVKSPKEVIVCSHKKH